MKTLRTLLAALVMAAGFATAASAQERPGSLTITVYDTTGAAIAATNVNLTAPDGKITQQLADEKGTVTFQALLPGKYAVVAEFPGFEPNAAAELQVRAGRNTKQDITLEIAGFVEQVEVEQDTADRAVTDSFSTALSASQIEALADDPDEMQQQLEQLAGPGARIRVNGFEGGQLPPKSQIREIRFRFDPFAAENHNAGFPRVDIITRPGNGPDPQQHDVRIPRQPARLGQLLLVQSHGRPGLRDRQGQGQTYRYGWSIDGPIVKGRTGFSLNVRSNNEYDVQTIVATTPAGTYNSLVNQPSDRLNVDFNIEHVLTKTHTLRFQFDRDTNSAENLGIGNFDLETRGYSREGFTNRGARVRRRLVRQEVPQRDPRAVLLAGDRVRLGERRDDHPRAGPVHRRRRADPGRPQVLGTRGGRQPRHPARQEAQPAHRVRAARRATTSATNCAISRAPSRSRR